MKNEIIPTNVLYLYIVVVNVIKHYKQYYTIIQYLMSPSSLII